MRIRSATSITVAAWRSAVNSPG